MKALSEYILMVVVHIVGKQRSRFYKSCVELRTEKREVAAWGGFTECSFQVCRTYLSSEA